MAENNNSLILLMLHVHHRLWLCSTCLQSKTQTDGASPTWDITGLMAKGKRTWETHMMALKVCSEN